MKLLALDLKMPFNADESTLKLLINANTRIPADRIENIRIVRRSLDARDKNDINFIYSASFEIDERDYNRFYPRFSKSVQKAPEPPVVAPIVGEEPLPAPILVAGAGPAGLFAALTYNKCH